MDTDYDLKGVSWWEDRFGRRPVRTSLQLALGVAAAAVVVVAMLWVTGVVTVPWVGTGDAYRQKESAQNWIAAQRRFRQELNDVDAANAKIQAAKQQLATFTDHNPAPSSDPIAYQQWSQEQNNYQTAVTGPQQECQNTVADYNTDAQSYLTEDWRDAALPLHLDPSVCN